MAVSHIFKRNAATGKLLLQRLKREMQMLVFFSTSAEQLLLLCT